MSSNWTLTAEARTPPANHSSDVTTREALNVALERRLDKIYKRDYNEPFMGEQFVRFMKVKFDHGKMATLRGYSGTIPISRDADDIAFANMGEGFPWEWNTVTYRRGIKIERKTIELDDIGATKSAQRDLLEMFKRTVEYQIADALNRALGAAGSPLLADDGMYPVDDNRPNFDGARWSNLEATADLTEDTLFEASENASEQVSEDGNLFPQEIKHMIIPKARELQMWKLLSTEKVLGSNHNDRNWAQSAFKMSDVTVYPYMRTDQILYLLCDPKSEDNEFVIAKRVDPSVLTGWGTWPNPDVQYQRLRADFGLALGSPRKFIRGGFLATGSGS